MHHQEPYYQFQDWFATSKVKVTVRVHIHKKSMFLLCLPILSQTNLAWRYIIIMNCWLFCNQTKLDGTSSASLFSVRLDCVTMKVKNSRSQWRLKKKKKKLHECTFAVTLNLERKAIFSQNSMGYDNVPPYQVWLQKDKRLRKYFQLYFHIWSYCDLDLEDTKVIFCMTLLISMTHHHTTSGYNRSSTSKDNVRTFIKI